MRALLIVIANTLGDQMPCVAEIAKDVFVQTFIPEPGIESFTEGVLRWLAGRDVMPLQADVLRPCEHGVAGGDRIPRFYSGFFQHKSSDRRNKTESYKLKNSEAKKIERCCKS